MVEDNPVRGEAEDAKLATVSEMEKKDSSE
jgi:hypothetical protein